jgi:hypothetical protein
VAGFTSFDDIFAEITAGKILKQMWNKQTGAAAYTAGRWYNLFTLGGMPFGHVYGGTTLTFQALTDASQGAMYIGGNKTPDTRHLLNMEAVCGVATGVPSWLVLVDLLGYYPSINMNSNSLQTLDSVAGTNVLPNRQGAQASPIGVHAFLEVQSGPTGAVAHNLAYSYTNSALANPKTNPATVALTVSAIVPHMAHSGLAVNNYGPMLPLAVGDLGIASVQNVQLSAASGSASTAALVLFRPIAQIPLPLISVAVGRDLLFNWPSLPQVHDGACLAWLLFAGGAVGAATNFYGAHDLVWG